MELRDFVKATLVQIVEGVREAQSAVASAGAAIVPKRQGLDDGRARNRLVEFDVGVTVSEGLESKDGVGIFIAGIGIGAQGQSATTNAIAHRVRFSVPVFLPSQRVPAD